jgi:hypothetical protein
MLGGLSLARDATVFAVVSFVLAAAGLAHAAVLVWRRAFPANTHAPSAYSDESP